MMSETKRYAVLAAVLIVVVGAVLVIEQGKVAPVGGAAGDTTIVLDQNERTAQKEKKYERAKDISSPDGFLNTEPFSLADEVGKKVVLVDFWTYSCINCQRTLPYLEAWQKKYGDKGLLIVGVHTPEFEFEKKFDNVKRAVEKYGLTYPVVLDNDFSTWRAYENRYWPRKYLVDVDGFIVYDHIGEGGYEETEQKIVELLNERTEVLGLSADALAASDGMPQETTQFDKILTPEIYFGSARAQHLGNLPNQSCRSTTCDYAPKDTILGNTYQLVGSWKTYPDRVELASDSGVIGLRFSAGKVNLVAGADSSVTLDVLLDGNPVTADVAGSDVVNGTVTVQAHDLYNVIDLGDDYGEHILQLRVRGQGLEAFTFTFG